MFHTTLRIRFCEVNSTTLLEFLQLFSFFYFRWILLFSLTRNEDIEVIYGIFDCKTYSIKLEGCTIANMNWFLVPVLWAFQTFHQCLSQTRYKLNSFFFSADQNFFSNYYGTLKSGISLNKLRKQKIQK